MAGRVVKAVIRLSAAIVALATAGCVESPPRLTAANPAASGYKAVLVAGDGSLPVFDNATAALATRLAARGTPMASISRLSAQPAVAGPGIRTATLDIVEAAVAGMRPASGQACLVFATSHGAPRRGLYLSAYGEFLTPDTLDAALVRGCGNAPTVAIVSGCYTGGFAGPPMARPNRVVLTAARADRASFGCGAGRTYTFYDECLLGALDTGTSWQGIHDQTRACVARQEAGTDFPPSEPQAFFGRDAAALALPGRPQP